MGSIVETVVALELNAGSPFPELDSDDRVVKFQTDSAFGFT